MRRKWKIPSAVLVVAVLLGSTAIAATQAYDLDWWTVDGGGNTSSGGVYSLSATIGQPDAGSLSGGDFTLAGGYWSEAVSVPPVRELYLPLVNR